jgi:hypothetical protein
MNKLNITGTLGNTTNTGNNTRPGESKGWITGRKKKGTNSGPCSQNSIVNNLTSSGGNTIVNNGKPGSNNRSTRVTETKSTATKGTSSTNPHNSGEANTINNDGDEALRTHRSFSSSKIRPAMVLEATQSHRDPLKVGFRLE